MKSHKFTDYVEDRDAQDVGPEPMSDGEMTHDPDKPDKTTDLIRALEDVIATAKKALDARAKGLGDLSGNGKPTDDDDRSGDGQLGKTIVRPGADTAGGTFGQDD